MPDRPLTSMDLINSAEKLQIPNFRGVFMRNTLPSRMRRFRECGIVNLDVLGGAGTHWVAYIKVNTNKILYFDPMGDLKPPLELQGYFTNKCDVYYNFKRFQRSGTYYCGHLCLHFLVNNTSMI